MEDNPYSKILNIIRNQASGQIPVTFRFGTVVSSAPLKIDVSDTTQTGEDLLKNAAIGELHSGDSVLLVPIDDGQKFIVLCKVVGV